MDEKEDCVKEFCKLHYSDMTGLEYDSEVTRRDPSPVICVDDCYYVYYSKASGTSGYAATIWCARSKDGIVWTELGEAIGKGEKECFDAGGVFTPTIFLANEKVYMIYTAVPYDFQNDSTDDNGKTAFGMAVSDTPDGVFRRISNEPFFRTTEKGEFDSHRIDDSCIIHRNNKYYLYYKGRELGLSPRETKMGVAISEKPEGPYIRYEKNFIVDSGHEVCVYPSRSGVIAMLTDTGPQGNTVQYSEDGINFEKIGDLVVPKSFGPYREDGFENNKSFELKWGVCHVLKEGRPYLKRIDLEY